ncbi:hypothetical protein J437_LFUL015368 [Ladona fulva]|uniref:Uncharacterized protein n=1 Tax=Ladona fulva TaxID=123851 RepID=A0A8K0KK60_LADFU|nr:hypothetical protein J437_LFUL015368 [Ladona fulva]
MGPGGIDRDTRETFLCVVDQRDASTLREAIERFVKKGTCIETAIAKISHVVIPRESSTLRNQQGASNAWRMPQYNSNMSCRLQRMKRNKGDGGRDLLLGVTPMRYILSPRKSGSESFTAEQFLRQ